MTRKQLLHDVISLAATAQASIYVTGGKHVVTFNVEPLVRVLTAVTEELSKDPPQEVFPALAERLKVALEHESTDARVLLGRLLTELERTV